VNIKFFVPTPVSYESTSKRHLDPIDPSVFSGFTRILYRQTDHGTCHIHSNNSHIPLYAVHAGLSNNTTVIIRGKINIRLASIQFHNRSAGACQFFRQSKQIALQNAKMHVVVQPDNTKLMGIDYTVWAAPTCFHVTAIIPPVCSAIFRFIC